MFNMSSRVPVAARWKRDQCNVGGSGLRFISVHCTLEPSGLSQARNGSGTSICIELALLGSINPWLTGSGKEQGSEKTEERREEGAPIGKGFPKDEVYQEQCRLCWAKPA